MFLCAPGTWMITEIDLNGCMAVVWLYHAPIPSPDGYPKGLKRLGLPLDDLTNPRSSKQNCGPCDVFRPFSHAHDDRQRIGSLVSSSREYVHLANLC